MKRTFTANQSVDFSVPALTPAIQEYLQQPQRLICALTNPGQIEPLRDNTFRIALRPLQFLTLRFQPVADLTLQPRDDGQGVDLYAENCRVEGAEFLNRSAVVRLKGELGAQQDPKTTRLSGTATLTVELELPLPLRAIPKPVLQPAGNTFLRGLLLTIKQRLEKQLPEDYQSWVKVNQSPAIANMPARRF